MKKNLWFYWAFLLPVLALSGCGKTEEQSTKKLEKTETKDGAAGKVSGAASRAAAGAVVGAGALVGAGTPGLEGPDVADADEEETPGDTPGEAADSDSEDSDAGGADATSDAGDNPQSQGEASSSESDSEDSEGETPKGDDKDGNTSEL